MTVELQSALTKNMEAAAAKAGLVLASAGAGTDFHGAPTAVFELSVPSAAGRTLKLELSEGFDFSKPELLPEMTAHLVAAAKEAQQSAAPSVM